MTTAKTTRTCATCDNPVQDQDTICNRCVRVTSHNLTDMAGHASELMLVMSKQTQYAERSDGGKAANPAMAWARMGDQYLDDVAADIRRNPIAAPYSRAAADVWHELRSTLVSWVRLVHEEYRPVEGPRCKGPCPHRSCHAITASAWPQNTVQALSLNLYANLRILKTHPAGGEFVAEITKVVKRIMVVIDSPAFRAKIPVGPCVQDLEVGPCPGQVVAYTYRDEDLIGTMACRWCKTEWSPRQWYEIGAKIIRRKRAESGQENQCGPRCRSRLCEHKSCWAIKADAWEVAEEARAA